MAGKVSIVFHIAQFRMLPFIECCPICGTEEISTDEVSF